MISSLLHKIERRALKLLDKSDIRTRDLVDFLKAVELTPSDIEVLMYLDAVVLMGANCYSIILT